MTFDFKKLARGQAISSITDPVALFDALPNKAEGYGYLRAAQKTILDAWSPRRNERDLVIKTNTGAGKTIAGLLILQACIHENMVPALYLVPDPHLQQQVLAEAEHLGLRTVNNPEDSKFISGDSICVTTMQVLINGKSRFGLTNNIRPPLPLRAVVVDDAHAALLLTEEQTNLKISFEHPAYNELLNLFEDELGEQNFNALSDIRDRDPAASTLRIPFWSWYDKRQQVLKILRPYRADEDFMWSWPFVADLLQWCQATINTNAIEITPPCPPIEKILSFAQADRRIYLTATLADDSVLLTHFAANPESVNKTIVPDSAADLGDRLILAPLALNSSINHDDVRAMIRSFAEDYNVVVLVPSHNQAAQWSDVANATVSKAAEISSVVEQLKASHVGVVVIVNRYDGIDLPDTACRVLVIDGLPQAYSGTERRETIALRNSDAMVTRQLQRLEQGMGRAVRSRDDRCVVLLLDPRLVQLISRADVTNRLSPATKAQLDLSHRIAERLDGANIAELQGVIAQVLSGDPGFRELSREALVGVTYGPALLSPSAGHLRCAYDAAVSGQTAEACKHADNAIKAAVKSGDERLAGWLGETLATYQHAVDAVKAQEILNAAINRNPTILRPRGGLSYHRVTVAGEQSRLACTNLLKRFRNGAALLVGVDAVLADLVWDNERTDTTENALGDLAGLLGLVSQRPERDYGRGSDVLWALSNEKFAVIEAKSGSVGEYIAKKDINQLAGSVNWCRAEYGGGISIVPLIMHPSNIVHKSGTPPQDTRVLNRKKLEELKTSVLAYARALAHDDPFCDETKVQKQLREHKLLGTELFSVYSVAAKCQN